MANNKVNNAIEYAKALTTQLEIQQDVIDKWFRFHLIMIGAIAAGIGVLIKNELLTNSKLALICLCVFILGMLFFLLHVRQRINNIMLYKKIEMYEEIIIKPAILKICKKDIEEFYEPFKYGADFWAISITIFLNSIWITMAVFFTLCYNNFSCIELVVFVVCILLQVFVRDKILHHYDKHKGKDLEKEAKKALKANREWASQLYKRRGDQGELPH